MEIGIKPIFEGTFFLASSQKIVKRGFLRVDVPPLYLFKFKYHLALIFFVIVQPSFSNHQKRGFADEFQ